MAHVWIIRDYIRDDTMELRVGHTVIISIQPWDEVRDSLESIQHIRLSSENVLASPEYYAVWDSGGGIKSETDPAQVVMDGASPNGTRPVQTDRNSPVLLLGDRFTYFLGSSFTAGSVFGAGLQDYLSFELGFEIDRLSMLGKKSGVNGVRIDAALDGNRYDGKEVVVWCFTSEALTGLGIEWKIVPLDFSEPVGQ